MLVVLDTNVIVQARAAGHVFHRILLAWFSGDFTIALSTEILLEYQEVVTERAGASRWHVLAQLLDGSAHVLRVSPTFRLHLITADADDDKFVDCAIAANADFIITEDHHFDAMLGRGYKPQPITPEEFIRLHLGSP